MELDDIKRYAQAAREFSIEVDAGVHITLRVPTRHESQLLSARAQAAEGRGAPSLVLFQRLMVVRGVVAWSGVMVRHVLPEHPLDEVLPVDPGVTETLLDAQPDWAASLLEELFERIAKRENRKGAAEKN